MNVHSTVVWIRRDVERIERPSCSSFGCPHVGKEDRGLGKAVFVCLSNPWMFEILAGD